MSTEFSAAQNNEAWFCCILQTNPEAVAPLSLTWPTTKGLLAEIDLADQPSPLQWPHSWLMGKLKIVDGSSLDLEGFSVN